jgi:hypothetical protein
MSFIVFCLFIAVVWLFIRVNTLNEANDELRERLNLWGRHLHEIQTAQKAALAAKATTSAPAETAPIPPPAVEVAESDYTLVVPPPPGPEPVLDAHSVEMVPESEVIAMETTLIAPVALEEEARPAAVPPPIPIMASVVPTPPVPTVPAYLRTALPEPEPASQTPSTPSLATTTPAAPPAPPQSFELRLGTYWFVRAGVVILLTGFVFLANLAYRQIVPQLGPAGKIALLYLGSAALLGAGAWLSRKSAKESLNNFAQVLLAGGLGAVYFSTYAAHHYEPLRVIGSAALDGALLLGWAGFIVWLADRRKSETLALFALGLGYYTAVVTRVGTFTLASNLVLTIATVFFLVRNRWAHLTLAGLVASYGGFAFWRFFHDGHWLLGAPRENLPLAIAFLAGYWVCYTAATFLAEGDTLADKRRAAFLSANNGAFFALAVLSLAAHRDGRLWEFCLAFGAVLLGLAAFARMRLPQEPSVRAAYVTQGLLLVTVGLIIKFTGHQLAVLLAAESVVLLTLGLRQPSRLLRAGAFVTAALAVGWLVLTARPGDSPVLGLGVTALLLFNAWWMGRHKDPADAALLRARTSVFSVLALVAGGASLVLHAATPWIPVWLAGAALLLTLSMHWLRTRELTLFGQGYLFLAHGYWLLSSGGWAELPAWRPLLLLAGTLAVLHWWTRQTVIGGRNVGETFETGYAIAVVALLYSWLHGHFSAEHWLLVSSALALAVTAYGALTRAWRLAAAGQCFALVAAAGFARHLEVPHPDWTFALAPIAMLVIVSGATHWATVRRAQLGDEVRAALQVVAAAYQWVAFAMMVAMVFRYVPEAHRPWTFALLGGAFFAVAGWLRTPQPLMASGLLLALGLLTLLTPGGPGGTLFSVPNLLAVLLPLVLQQVARRTPGRFPVPANMHIVVLVFAGGFLWLHMTRWLLLERDGHYFTLAWSVLGPVFFAIGLWLRERTYFALGLGCLAAALFRVVLHDVWQPELFVMNLLPMFAVLALQRVARKHPDGAAVPDTAHMAAIAVSGLSLWLFLTRWLLPTDHGNYLTLAWSVLGPVFFVAGLVLRERTYFVLGLGCLGAALLRSAMHDAWQAEILLFNLLPMLLVLLLQRVARRHPDGAALPDTVHMTAILAAGLSLWLFLSRWVVQASGGKIFLTASWAALALLVFATGFALRERTYRWLGLGVLAGALGRVVFLDVWQLALVYRVLAFMALGVALIVLGYVYNRWQDKIREWL